MRAALRTRMRAGDSGLTLAELLVYSVLLLVVVAITGTLLIRGFLIQRDVRDMTTASNDGQVTMASIEAGLRNAATVTTPSVFDGRLLVVMTRVGDQDDAPSSWQCRGWLYDTASKSLRTIEGAPGAAAPTKNLSLTSDFSAWRTILTDVVPVTRTGVTQPVFAAEGATGSQILFDVLEGADGKSVTFGSAAIPRPQGTITGGETCS